MAVPFDTQIPTIETKSIYKCSPRGYYEVAFKQLQSSMKGDFQHEKICLGSFDCVQRMSADCWLLIRNIRK